MSKCRHASKLNAAKRIEELQIELEFALVDSTSTYNQISTIQKELSQAYRDEESYWKQKSRNTWLEEGDRNTKFFQACTETRFSRNRIVSIKDKHGNLYRGDVEVGHHAEEFFKDVYTTTQQSCQEDIFHDFQPTITLEMNAKLTAEISEKEIVEALDSIGPDRAPGPDGLTARFHQSCWDTVGAAVTTEVKNFFHSSYMKRSINLTNICMIPKINKPDTLSDFRPIGLCNVLYKIISKILVRRLKLFLDKIVSDSQSAFIPGRMITDNILIAHELMHSLKSRKHVSKTYLATKTDISKAYDRIE